MAVNGLIKIKRILAMAPQSIITTDGNGKNDLYYDMVILDEVTIALKYKLLDITEVIRVIEERNPTIEVIVTGRGAPDELIGIGDLVTEMKAIRHYYEQGVLAREGIER